MTMLRNRPVRPVSTGLLGDQDYRTYQEEQPLLSIKHGQQCEWIGHLGHRWFESRNASRNIAPCRHVLVIHSRLVVPSRLVMSLAVVV